jgi:hypothetical protein
LAFSLLVLNCHDMLVNTKIGAFLVELVAIKIEGRFLDD